jgi:hypothetical protein
VESLCSFRRRQALVAFVTLYEITSFGSLLRVQACVALEEDKL